MDIDIMDMECRLFRMAQKEWKLDPSECAKIFLVIKYLILLKTVTIVCI